MTGERGAGEEALDQELRGELLALARRDRRQREQLAASGELHRGYAPAMERVHVENARRLEPLLDRVGWPGRSLVGAEAAAAAWLVAQHAISQPAFQRRCRELLAGAVERGEAPPHQLARLTDRIRFSERRPQVYGTIFDWDRDGRLSPWSIEDPEGVEARRRAAGLPPLAEAIREARRRARIEGESPSASFEERQEEIREWSRSVGWLQTGGGSA